jgi:hypothetical protein
LVRCAADVSIAPDTQVDMRLLTDLGKMIGQRWDVENCRLVDRIAR